MENKSFILTALMILFVSLLSCNAQSEDQKDTDQTLSTSNVEVYYFHFSRRCATCQAVEEESEKALRELYPEKVKAGEIVFLSLDLEDESNTPLAEKYNVSGQTLLVVKGDEKDNLTNIAFMHARSNPEKLKKALRESIEKL
jgi:hypothetical protein